MKVSIIITSFNHANTLRRAIESVLRQKTDFKTEIIVVDDGSTDESPEIIREYIEKLDFASCLGHQGIMATYFKALNRCTGDYICFCDCDDYWTDEFKLQKQADYMDANPDCGLCVTKVASEYSDGSLKTGMFLPDEITYDKLLRGNAYLHAQSYMIRKSDYDKYINFEKFIHKRFHVWDYPIVLELAQHTRFHCLDFYSAVYVKNPESFTNTRKRWKRLKYIIGSYYIRTYYITRYGCKFNTFMYLIYRFTRDIYSVIFKRWNH